MKPGDPIRSMRGLAIDTSNLNNQRDVVKNEVGGSLHPGPRSRTPEIPAALPRPSQ